MKTTLIVLSLLIITIIIAFFILGVLSRSGDVPGLVEGSLLKCPNRPNCVCSEQKDDAKHYINPITLYENDTVDNLSVLKNAVQEMGGSIQLENDNYFASSFSSDIFGFVDDLEVRIDTSQKVIHIRSASRVGYSDRGVNKNRVELLKQIYGKKLLEVK